MPLLVVPLAPEDAGLLTLTELDDLTACERILFERSGHPLLDRLRALDLDAAIFDDEPDARREGWALVCDPESPRLIELARQGARVVVGPARVPDALTAAHAAPLVRRAAASLGSLVAIMARLRSDDGCPWDREQTHESLVMHLLEEAYEVIDAIERGEEGEELEEELGDLLLQVAFHSQLAYDAGRFDVAGVADRIVAKLLHRHPHVFGDVTVGGASEVVANWEEIKAKEKDRSDPFEGIPKHLPALLAAYKTQKRAAALGWRASEQDARAGLDEALAGDRLGEALLWLVALARARGLDPEGALREATARFRSSL